MAGDGTLSNYKDVIELVDDDHRMLTGHVQQPDGRWRQFMTTHYRRQA
jgi:hypothetical protein